MTASGLPAPMRLAACDTAMGAGVLGAVVAMATLDIGDGQHRVTIIVRAAVTYLAFAVAALAIRPHLRSPTAGTRLLCAMATLANAAALARAFFSAHSETLSPMSALGSPTILIAFLQVGAFAVATASAMRVSAEP